MSIQLSYTGELSIFFSARFEVKGEAARAGSGECLCKYPNSGDMGLFDQVEVWGPAELQVSPFV